METRKLPLHNIHADLGGKFVPFAGFEMPVRYSSGIEEHMAVRNSAGIFDVSHMGEFVVEGPAALDLIQYVTSNDASTLKDGQAQYSCLPNGNNGIVDDIIVYRISQDHYMLVVNAANIQKDWDWITSHNNTGAVVTNRSDDFCLFAVQGPKTAPILQSLTKTDLHQIPYYHFAYGELAGNPGILISNTGYTGAGGFELYVPVKVAESVWRSVMEAGKSYALLPAGLGARDTLRLEMGYCLYGNDIDDTTSPLEAGLGWITKFTKPFVGSEALQEQKKEGVKRKLVGFTMIDRGIPRHGYDILSVGGQPIGKVTSGSQSPVLGSGIGLGYVETPHAVVGTEVLISVREKHLKARVVKTPFI